MVGSRDSFTEHAQQLQHEFRRCDVLAVVRDGQRVLGAPPQANRDVDWRLQIMITVRLDVSGMAMRWKRSPKYDGVLLIQLRSNHNCLGVSFSADPRRSERVVVSGAVLITLLRDAMQELFESKGLFPANGF